MRRKWRVGVIGLGHWYSAYGLARRLTREFPGAELVAVACHDEGQLREFGDAFQLDTYTDYGELLSREDIDIVQISLPVADIPKCTIATAESGKHILLGKPMAMTMEEADTMVDAVRRSGVKCVAYQGTSKLRLQDVKRRIEAGAIGDIVVMHATARWSLSEDWFGSGKAGWFADPDQVPGGALIDEGIYQMDALRWLADSEVVEVDARVANYVHKDLKVEDWGMATFVFESGVIATLECSWTITVPRLVPSPKSNAVRRLEIVGTEGEIHSDGLRDPGHAFLGRGHAQWTFSKTIPEPFNPYGPVSPFPLTHLIDCIESDSATIANIEAAREALRMALAAYRSARIGKRVSLAA